ncbi:YT521-B-like domain-containing protein [Mycena vitilis]|nr:YT521-B-like domain-containing protein [Mycena vitilis]
MFSQISSGRYRATCGTGVSHGVISHDRAYGSNGTSQSQRVNTAVHDFPTTQHNGGVGLEAHSPGGNASMYTSRDVRGGSAQERSGPSQQRCPTPSTPCYPSLDDPPQHNSPVFPIANVQDSPSRGGYPQYPMSPQPPQNNPRAFPPRSRHPSFPLSGQPMYSHQDREGWTWWYVAPHPAPPSQAPPSQPPRRTTEDPTWHPTPPSVSHRAVMWVDHVPHDASHTELWRFFAHRPDAGVCAISLAPQSGYAFVSYASAPHLHEAVALFNGRPLRGADAPLACRARREEGDPRVGVGLGIRPRSLSAPVLSHIDAPARPGSAESSSSQSSSNSNLLRRHFPQRFFILKSLTPEDLDRSVQTRLWAPQIHNAAILDRAFRTSQDVFLMFSVNKSGQFYGYARMAGHTSPDPAHSPDEGRGANIKLQWLCTTRLPFQRARHIHNPWNHDREIKVSRDGTELEPGVGRALLAVWRPEREKQMGAQAQRERGGGRGVGRGAGVWL